MGHDAFEVLGAQRLRPVLDPSANLRLVARFTAARLHVVRPPARATENRFHPSRVAGALSQSSNGPAKLTTGRTRRGGATTYTAGAVDIPRVSPPTPPGGRAASGRGRSTRCRAPRRRDRR